MREDCGRKVISAAKLRELLEPIGDNMRLIPNVVENLAIENEAGEFVGFVDLTWEEVVWYDREEGG